MADSRKAPRGRSRFFWFLVYIVIYIALRLTSEVAQQQIALPAPNGSVEIFRVIGPHPDSPHWRQQTWRALFSLPMVAEEEGRKIFAARSKDMGDTAQSAAQSAARTAEGLWADLKAYVTEFFKGR